jgi:hypothetical protein
MMYRNLIAKTNFVFNEKIYHVHPRGATGYSRFQTGYYVTTEDAYTLI